MEETFTFYVDAVLSIQTMWTRAGGRRPKVDPTASVNSLCCSGGG